MPSRKPPRKGTTAQDAASAPQWQVILEETRVGNALVLNAIQRARSEARREIQSFRNETRAHLERLHFWLENRGNQLRDLQRELKRRA